MASGRLVYRTWSNVVRPFAIGRWGIGRSVYCGRYSPDPEMIFTTGAARSEIISKNPLNIHILIVQLMYDTYILHSYANDVVVYANDYSCIC